MGHTKKTFEMSEHKIICELYNNGLPLNRLAKQYHTHQRVIKRVLVENNIYLRNSSEYNSKYKHNRQTFDKIETHEQAYWLGFLVGDGCIIDNQIHLALAKKDREHIQKFLDFMQSDHVIHDYERICEFSRKDGSTYTSYVKYSQICISSPECVKALALLGMIQNKTKRVKVPPIREEFFNSFILGLTDADGSWIKDKDRNGHKFLHFQIVGQKTILSNIQNILIQNLQLNKNKITKEEWKDVFRLKYGGNQVIKKIYNYLYKDSQVFLNRKKDIVINHYNDIQIRNGKKYL